MLKVVLLFTSVFLMPRFCAAQLLREGAESDRFEAVSIKLGPERPLLQSFPRILPGGVLQVNGAALRDLINWAYPSARGQVLMDGAPGWAGSERFDVLAKTSGPRPTAAMLRAALAERFKLRVRFEPRERNIFELRLARSDGRLGSALTTSNCLPDEAAPEAERCKTVQIGCCPGLIGEGVTIAELAGALTHAPILNAPVFDSTGLNGRFNFNLQYRAEGLPNADQRPDLSTALPEQLGLRLSRATRVIDVLIIEDADRLEQN